MLMSCKGTQTESNMLSHSKVKLGQGSCFSKSNEDSGGCKDSGAEYGDYPRDLVIQCNEAAN